MKKALNTFLILSVVFLIAGSIFMIFGFTGASLLEFGALLITIPIAVILYFIQRYKKQRSLYILIGSLPVLCLSVGLAFFINHYPFGEYLFITGLIIAGVYLIIMLFFALIIKQALTSLGVCDMLVLFVLVGLIFIGYTESFRLNYSDRLDNELNYNTARKEVADLQKINNSLYASYASTLKRQKVKVQTEKILYTIDTMQQNFLHHLIRENDTTGFFSKTYSSKQGKYFYSNEEASRNNLLQNALKNYLDSLKFYSNFHYFSSFERNYINDLLQFDFDIWYRTFNNQHVSRSNQFITNPGSALVYLEQLKISILLTENLMLNSWLRKKPADITISGIAGGSISKQKLLQANQIESSDSNFRIISYNLLLVDENKYIIVIPGTSNRFPDNWIDKGRTSSGNRFWIEEIRVLNSVGDTVNLEPVAYKIK